jgi:phosphatidylglycerol lysyltransferase
LHSNLDELGEVIKQNALELHRCGQGEIAFGRHTLFGHQHIAVLGNPIGPISAQNACIDQFIKKHKSACFYHIEKSVANHLYKKGYAITKMGVSHRIPLKTFTLTGKQKRTIRHLQNQALKNKLSVTELKPEAVPIESLKAISDKWLKSKPIKSHYMTFLLNPKISASNKMARWFIAKKHNAIVAFHCYTPIYHNNSHVGYYCDINRSDPTATKGAHTLITVTATLTFKAEELEILSLGLAPFQNQLQKDPLENDPITHLIFKWIYQFGNTFYNFKGLAMHKNHYRAYKEPIYLASPKKTPFFNLLATFWAM